MLVHDVIRGLFPKAQPVIQVHSAPPTDGADLSGCVYERLVIAVTRELQC